MFYDQIYLYQEKNIDCCFLHQSLNKMPKGLNKTQGVQNKIHIFSYKKPSTGYPKI